MKAVRILTATLFAPWLAALPYLAFGVYVFMTAGAQGGAPAVGSLAAVVLLLVVTLIATILLAVARFSWKERGMARKEHLFGWPTAFAGLFLALLAIPAWMEGLGSFVLVLATALVSYAAGQGAARFWLRFSYANEG